MMQRLMVHLEEASQEASLYREALPTRSKSRGVNMMNKAMERKCCLLLLF